MKRKRYVYVGAWFQPLSFNFLRRLSLPSSDLIVGPRKK